MELTPLTALSPLDGRYQEKLSKLRPLLSEYGLVRYRVLIEIRWLIWLSKEKQIPEIPPLRASDCKKLEQIASAFSLKNAEMIKTIERKTNHDVKAVEYFLQQQFKKDVTLKPLIPFIHFGCTSEDINNLSYSLMFTDTRDKILLPALEQLIDALERLATKNAGMAMLSRTHGQPATPTTLGKEIANFVARLNDQYQRLSDLPLTGKMNGAVGNFNAHRVAYPKVDWPSVSRRFVESLGLENNEYTTQIEPHDRLAELFHVISRLNNILINTCRDFWGYISLGYFQQKSVAGEIGSSTMPHKINPIDFENAEGNLGLANALLNHLSNKLPISRWQRDLSDSTVMRNCGTAFGYSLIAYQSINKGLSKLSVNESQIKHDLETRWEVVAEAVQTVMRRYGISEAYEKLKILTRGKSFDKNQFLKLINELPLPKETKKQLLTLTPQNYVGFAEKLTKKIG